MPTTSQAQFTAAFFNTLDQIDPEVWDGLAQASTPFMLHAFLNTLETSGCVHNKTGWQPHHLMILEDETPVAVMPLYIKHHSSGEYVFDHEWAQAYYRYGQDYFPKLVSSIPFTPVTGTRLAISETTSKTAVFDFAKQAVQKRCEQGFSSWHCLFTPPQQADVWQGTGLLKRLGVQFHWFNKKYQSFDEFLATMNAKKRKNIKRERRLVQEQGIEFIWKTPTQMTSSDWQDFFHCYATTYLVRNQAPYLNLEFFQSLAQQMSHQMLCLMAYKDQRFIASSLFFYDEHTLYGRYWGCLEEIEFLHFETCYYQGIDYAIRHNFKRFDAGAQGEHKIIRGFEPVDTHSWHWIQDESFRKPIATFVEREAEMVRLYQENAREYLPFKPNSQ